MSQRSKLIRLVCIVLLSLGIFVAFIWILGDFRMTPAKTIQVEFLDIGAIKRGTELKVGGFGIGRVSGIDFLPQRREDGAWLRLEVAVDADKFVALCAESHFEVAVDSVLGEPFLLLTAGSAAGCTPVREGHVFRGNDVIRLNSVARSLETTAHRLADAINHDEVDLVRLIVQFERTLVDFDALIVDTHVLVKAHADDVSAIVSDSRVLLESGKTYVARHGQTLDRMMVRADAAIGDAARAAAAIRRLAEGIDSDTPETLRQSLGNLQNASHALNLLLADLPPLLAQANASVEDVRAIMAMAKNIVHRLEQGQGSIGMFLRDEEIYDSVRDLVRELKRRPWRLMWKD
ncbi:MAG: hypothetical protein FWC40_03495 [Proteobacteria bacterium]|nr:hypothetical protein [Pseudomonadota bacterium]